MNLVNSCLILTLPEIQNVNKIALDCIVEFLAGEVKADRGYASKEQAEAWLFDGCCDTGMNTWFPDDLDRTQ